MSGSSSNGARLVLFDVDGTLLSAGRAARESILAALSAVLGWEGSADGHDFSGKTDPQILRELVLDAVGTTPFESALDAVLDRYVRELALRLTPHAVVPKPGVPALLERLAREPRVTLALLTGNIERGARMKLEPPGFNRFFPFGAFGNDSEDRYSLPAIAVARACERTGRDFSGESVVIIGDSVHDVACGRSLGARAIAVATGPTPAEKLAAERPGALFADFSDVEAAASAILR
jgi:phosphoglycolate phosphatase-like HAD superfamily hydrolase